MRRAGLAVTMILLAAFAACGGDDDEPAAQTLPPATLIETPSATPCAVEDASTQTRDNESDVFGPVIDVRHSAEACPRVVFEFKDAISGYSVGYKSGPFSECGSGAEVSTAAWNANAFVDVRLEPSGGPDPASGEAGEPYYKGPRDIEVDGEALKHLKVICDFEGVFEWVIGLDAKHPFTVTTFDEPPRLVIDFSEATA
jgi:hypothetical protein